MAEPTANASMMRPSHAPPRAAPPRAISFPRRARPLVPAALAALTAVALVPLATADDAAAPAVSTCVLKGSQPPAKGTLLYDASSAGRVIATFSGATVGLQMSEIPFDPSIGRAKVQTSNGAATVRLEGFVAPTSLTVYSVKDVPIVSGHVWISDGQKVKLAKTAANTITAELTLAGSQRQVVTGTGACDAFALEAGTVTTATAPGNGRVYLTKSTTLDLDLYDDANGTRVFSRSVEWKGQLFWSTEAKAGFVHVQTRGDLTVDAWARSSALDAIKRGELIDQTISSTTAPAGRQLALDKPSPLLKATKDIPIRARRNEKEKPIGVIERGAEFYVAETIVGWTNILPRHLGFTPPDDGGFWILSSDVPTP